jgi:hypothetical protein
VECVRGETSWVRTDRTTLRLSLRSRRLDVGEHNQREYTAQRSPGSARKNENGDSDSGAFLALVIHTCKFVRRRLDTYDSGIHDHRDGNPSHQKVGDARVIRNGLAM